MSVLRPTADELRGTIDDLGPWWHNLHLPGGVQTAPGHVLGDFPRDKWLQIARHLPEDLAGWRVLDVGCNAGFYSFELARRGATVVGVDVEDLYLRQARWAAGILGLAGRTEFRERSVYDLVEWSETFDLVVFMGLFYHLRHPLLALDVVRERVSRLLLFQSMTKPGDAVLEMPPDVELGEREMLAREGWPSMAFVERKLAGDATNWWIPDHACILALLRSVGMRVVARPGAEIYLCEPDPGASAAELARVRAELASATGLARERSAP